MKKEYFLLLFIFLFLNLISFKTVSAENEGLIKIPYEVSDSTETKPITVYFESPSDEACTVYSPYLTNSYDGEGFCNNYLTSINSNILYLDIPNILDRPYIKLKKGLGMEDAYPLKFKTPDNPNDSFKINLGKNDRDYYFTFDAKKSINYNFTVNKSYTDSFKIINEESKTLAEYNSTSSSNVLSFTPNEDDKYYILVKPKVYSKYYYLNIVVNEAFGINETKTKAFINNSTDIEFIANLKKNKNYQILSSNHSQVSISTKNVNITTPYISFLNYFTEENEYAYIQAKEDVTTTFTSKIGNKFEESNITTLKLLDGSNFDNAFESHYGIREKGLFVKEFMTNENDSIYIKVYLNKGSQYMAITDEVFDFALYSPNQDVIEYANYQSLDKGNTSRYKIFNVKEDGWHYIKTNSRHTGKIKIKFGQLYDNDYLSDNPITLQYHNISENNTTYEPYYHDQYLYKFSNELGEKRLISYSADSEVDLKVRSSISQSLLKSTITGLTNQVLCYRETVYKECLGFEEPYVILQLQGAINTPVYIADYKEVKKQGFASILNLISSESYGNSTNSFIQALLQVADPVNTLNGSFYTTYDFLKFNSLDDFKLTLNYDSIRGGLSEFGYQWEFNFGSKLTFNEDKTINVHFNNSQMYTYADNNNDGVYESIKNTAPYSKMYMENGNYYLVLKDKTKYEYNENGVLKKTFNAEGRYLEYVYENVNGESKLSQVTEHLTGNKIHFEYNQNGLITKAYDDYEREVSFTYNEKNELISFTNENGYDTTFDYNNYHQITLAKDSNEFVKNVYDSNGRVIKQYDANNKQTTFKYKENINESGDFQTIVTDRNGNTETFTFNGNYQLLSKIDKNGNETKFVHSDEFLLEEIDALNHSIKYGYDENGNLTSLTDAKGNKIHYEYDNNNNLVKTTQPNGNVIVNEYNSNNKLIKTKDIINNLTTDYSYNENGLPTKIIDNKGIVTENIYNNKYQIESIKKNNEITLMEYDVFGNNTKMTLSNGNFILKRYDKVGNLLEEENAIGHKVKYEYNFNNQISKVTDANGIEETYEYDGNLNLISVTKSNAKIQYKYDNEGNVIEEIDAKGNSTKYAYDKVGNLIKTTDSNNTDTTYEYDKLNRLIKMSRLNRTQTYEYDENDNVIKATDSMGNSTTYEYDNLDLLISETNALNQKTSYQYDSRGNIISSVDANHNKISLEYDNSDNLIKVIDAKGNITQNIYDTNNRLVQTINALGQSSFYSYDKNGNLVQALDNLSRPVITYGYDYAGRITAITDGLNHTSRTEYDNNGNVTKIFDNKDNLVTQTVYDEFNRPIQYKDINGNVELINYDLNGNVVSQIDALNRSQLFNYDTMDNLVSVVDKNNITSEQVFNDLQELVGYQDPNENTSNIEYDDLGRVIKELNASGGYSTYEYNAVGHLIKSTNAKGEETAYKYDSVGNLIELKDNVSTIKYTYDENYNVVKIEETGKNPIIQSYDALNRLTSVIDSNGKEIKYEYDTIGNLSKVIYPDNKEVTYTYDVLGNLLTVTDWNNRVTTYTYDENNQLLTTSKSDGSIEIREYNKKSQLSRLISKDKNGIIINDKEFEYDTVGNVIGEGEENYTYDNLDRLKKSNNAEYSYDNAGNITNALTTYNNVTNNAQMTYGSDNRITTFNDMSLNMDIEGNLLTVPKNNNLMNATYDSRNRLTSLDNDSYEYDALNNRIAVTENGVKTNFVTNYNSNISQILMEYDEEGNPIAYYVYGIGLISKEFVNGDNYVYHYDKRGSTIALTLNGEVTDTYEYDNYGELLNSSGDTLNRFKYNGKYGVQTDNSGLYYMRSRYYSPEMKRFINRDVVQGDITQSQTFNRFAYVNGNPVSYIDPFGLSRELADSDLSFLDKLQGFLELAGWFPVFGEAADIINGFIYLAKGEYGNAFLSFGSAVPVAGYIVSGSKVAIKGFKAVSKKSDNAIDGSKKVVKKDKSRTNQQDGCNCFVAGTLVLTISGYIPIEDIQIGDYVLSKDEITGDIDYKPVIDTIENEKDIQYSIHIGEEIIQASDSHPFWVENEQKWIASNDLVVGDILQTSDGQFLPITDIIVEEKPIKVYNLTVADYHTYFVTKTGFWVHNATCNLNAPFKSIDDVKNHYNDILKNGYIKPTASKFTSTGKKRQESDILRDNMLNDGLIEPKYDNEAHHILPSSLLKDKYVKKLLDELEVNSGVRFDSNSSSNGIFLPGRYLVINSKNKSKILYGNEWQHRGRHTGQYNQYVLNKLKSANIKTNDDLIAVLNEIRADLLDGKSDVMLHKEKYKTK